MSSGLVSALTDYHHRKQQRALRAAMQIGNPKARVRAYLLDVGHGKARTRDLASLLHVKVPVARAALKSLHYQYGIFGEKDGYWYATPETPIKAVRS